MFTGSCVAIVTPMQANGQVDIKALKDLVEWHILNGTSAIVVAGTTGESSTLEDSEIDELLIQSVDVTKGRVPVIAGTGCYSTDKTIKQTRRAHELGCDGALIITPYYNKPTQQGLVAHFQAIHEATEIPIILYNNPARTACDLLPETVATLSQCRRIIGIKEATGDLNRVSLLSELCEAPFKLYSGDDGSAFDFMVAGGHGVISIAANLIPKTISHLCNLIFSGEIEQAKALNQRLKAMYKFLTIESNPIPVKWALNRMGRIPGGIRLPLTELSKSHQQSFDEVLQAVGVVNA